ncbi:YcgL domain-containing protein [Kushneria sp. TE3]|uniref:YcgL domain-containing protein n=1 Tax=Kushneria sp. TE3 TaxID=3449832 RepID=UPI003F6891A0
MTPTPLLCQIYKSARHEEMFLYVDRTRGLDVVPQELLTGFGPPVSIMMMIMTPERTLARVDTARVIEALKEKGYYLQMPPGGDARSRDLAFDVGASADDQGQVS